MGLGTAVDCNIDRTISENFQQLRKRFRIKWSDHKCEVVGCGTAIISDGGMKPHRKVIYIVSYT